MMMLKEVRGRDLLEGYERELSGVMVIVMFSILTEV